MSTKIELTINHEGDLHSGFYTDLTKLLRDYNFSSVSMNVSAEIVNIEPSQASEPKTSVNTVDVDACVNSNQTLAPDEFVTVLSTGDNTNEVPPDAAITPAEISLPDNIEQDLPVEISAPQPSTGFKCLVRNLSNFTPVNCEIDETCETSTFLVPCEEHSDQSSQVLINFDGSWHSIPKIMSGALDACINPLSADCCRFVISLNTDDNQSFNTIPCALKVEHCSEEPRIIFGKDLSDVIRSNTN